MRKLITIILAVVLLVSLINLKNELNDTKQCLQDENVVKKELEANIASLESDKKNLLTEVSDLKTNISNLKSDIKKLETSKKELDKAYEELEIAYQNEYPDIGVTLKEFVQNFEYLTQNVDNFKEKSLKLPSEGEVLMGVDGRNFNTRYYIESSDINYSFNIGSRLNKNNILKIRMNYNNLTGNEEVAERIIDYTKAILSAYFMALESPMQYTDEVEKSVQTLMETGDYVKGDLVMKCSLDSYNGFTYIKNRNGLLSIFD
jgi:DNA repair exonuclease SbcCD ATPase subunit